MIGIFDSGSGGLTFLAAMKRRYPEWSYIYHADYDHCPYGDRDPEEIQSLTIAGVQKLFDAGAAIVILACNTASAWTLRKLQNEIFPDKRILGVTIPWAEKVVELGLKEVTVFATEQTVKSKTYADRVRILDSDTIVHEIAISGDLVREIEDLLPVKRCRSMEDFQKLFSLYTADGWNCDTVEWSSLVEKYFLAYSTQMHYDAVVLGCTHYSYIKKPLQIIFPGLKIIDPSEEAAEKLALYIAKHDVSVIQSWDMIFI